MNRKDLVLVVAVTLAWPLAVLGLGGIQEGVPTFEPMLAYGVVGLVSGLGLVWVLNRVKDPLGRHGSML